ncbi:MAG TPA: hypothetical protein VFE79_19110, partial [Paraburkholderia sp.]|nr:hypothetical protein [Paraburkholderia sp.]
RTPTSSRDWNRRTNTPAPAMAGALMLHRIAPLADYFESHDFRCSSKNARTCSGNSAPKNSTPTGSGSGQKTLSGVGIFGGLESMIFLLYKPIICLGLHFAPAPGAPHVVFVALTEQAYNYARSLNRIYRLSLFDP